MNIEQASNFLVGSILVGVGFIVLVAAIVVINNILSRYWRPVNFGIIIPKIFSESPGRFATDEEIARVAPQFDKKSVDLSKNK
jgi:hypothetical protein